jgi:hypothetical protein
MPTYSVSVLGDELVSRNLMRMGASAENMQIPLTEVAAIVRDKLTDNFDDEGPGSLALGSSVPYAGFHQTGTGTMPARPQRLPERTKRDAVKVLQRFLVEAGRGL